MEHKSDFTVCASTTRVTSTEETFEPHNPLNRPKIHYKKPIVALAIYVVLFVLLIPIPYGSGWLRALALVAYSIIYFSIIAKKTVIWLVHFYQNKASDKTRLQCVMEPSCSEYMILAVEKYGVVKGVFKGIGRLMRCGITSGVDYP